MDSPIVRVANVVKTFGETVRALDDVSLEFEPGIVYGLLGPNGAGKTTLIRVLTTPLKPDSGYAEVAGVDVLEDPVAARTHIGLAGTVNALRGPMLDQEALTDFQPAMDAGQPSQAVAAAPSVSSQVLMFPFWSAAILVVSAPLVIRVDRKTVS